MKTQTIARHVGGRGRLGLLLGLLMAALVLPSCANAGPRKVVVVRHHPARTVAVVRKPAPPKPVQRVWVRGHYALTPHGWRVWVPGHWRIVY